MLDPRTTKPSSGEFDECRVPHQQWQLARKVSRQGKINTSAKGTRPLGACCHIELSSHPFEPAILVATLALIPVLIIERDASVLPLPKQI